MQCRLIRSGAWRHKAPGKGLTDIECGFGGGIGSCAGGLRRCAFRSAPDPGDSYEPTNRQMFAVLWRKRPKGAGTASANLIHGNMQVTRPRPSARITMIASGFSDRTSHAPSFNSALSAAFRRLGVLGAEHTLRATRMASLEVPTGGPNRSERSGGPRMPDPILAAKSANSILSL